MDSLDLEQAFVALAQSLNVGDVVYPTSILPHEKSKIAEAILENARTEFSIARQMGNDSFTKMTYENAESSLTSLSFFSDQIETPTPLMKIPTSVSISVAGCCESYLATLERIRDQG